MTLSLVAVFIPVLLPGRAHRPAVPGVRGHHRRGDPGLRRSSRSRSRRCCAAAGSSPSRAGRAARAVLPGHRAGLGALARLVRAEPGLGDGPPRRWPCSFSAADPGRHDRAGPRSCPRGSSRARTRASSTAPPRRRRAPATTRWCSTSGRPRRSCRRTPTSRASCRRWAPAAAAPRSTRAGSSSTSSRATSGRSSADEVARSLTRKLAAVPGMRVFITNPPVINIGGRSVQEPVPVHAAELRHRRAVPGRRGARAAAARRPGADRRHQRPADQEPAGPGEHRPRPRRGARHRRRTRSRTRSTTRTARGRSAPSTRPTTSTGW